METYSFVRWLIVLGAVVPFLNLAALWVLAYARWPQKEAGR